MDAATGTKPGAGCKRFTFTDTRQGAARYAAYLQGTSNEKLYRHLMARATRKLNQDERVPNVEKLARRCVALAEGYGIYGETARYASPAQRRRWVAEQWRASWRSSMHAPIRATRYGLWV